MNKILKMLNYKTKWQLMLFYSLFVCMPMSADMRIPFVMEPDTVKIPSDTTQIDTTGMRDNPPVVLTPSLPPSPQAEAFQRVGEYTVNNASGIPDISIPLYEINHHGYKIPITLRYIATPLKSGYNYDVTGQGWILTTGFCISRTIASRPDELANFKLNDDSINCSQCQYQYYRENLNLLNYQRDLFKCVLPNGDSFQFYMTKNGNSPISYTLSTKRDFLIVAQANTTEISKFTVTDDSGVVYTFDIIEKTTDSQYPMANVGWYLSRIDLPNCTSPIYLQYNASMRQYHIEGQAEQVISMIHNHPYPNDLVQVQTANISQPSYYTTKLLTRINYGNESITFTYKNGTNEQDYNYLSKMTVVGRKEYRFNYSISNPYHPNHPLALLNRLVVKGPVTSPTDSLVYKFDYHTPAAFNNTDHWGYLTNEQGTNYQHNLANMNFYFECLPGLNPQISSSTFVKPLGTDPDGWCPYQKYSLNYYTLLEERRHALPPSSHSVLKSITYPTGGKTVFVFENHRFVTATAANGDFVLTKKQRRVIEGGGFRIKTITNYTSDNTVADVRQYRYGPTFLEANNQNLNLPVDPTNLSCQHIGFGEPVVDPNILSYSHFSTSGPNTIHTEIRYMLLGLSPAGQRTNFANPFNDLVYGSTWRFDVQFSPVFFRSLLRGRNAVVYPEITVYYGDIGSEDDTPENTTGKTVYKFDIYGFPNDTTYCQSLQYYGNTLDGRLYTAAQDQPIEMCDYAYEGNSFKMRRKVSYEYLRREGQLIDYVFKNIYSPGFGDTAPMNTIFGQRELFAHSYLLNKKQTTEYYLTDSISTTENIYYTSNDLIGSRTVTGKKLMTTTYSYPDLLASGGSGLLAAQNRMTTVLESRTKAGEGSSQIDVSGYKTDYENFTTGGLLPSKQYSLNTTFSGSSFEEDVQVLSYTSNGNPLEVVDRSGLHTVYLWSYKDRYMVAEIKNATLTQVNTALNAVMSTNASGLANLSSVSSATLKNLRTNSALSGALVTTWTYAPLIGVTSQTDPSGVSTYYDYDGLGRLKEIYRFDGNNESSTKRILNQYSYHTINN